MTGGPARIVSLGVTLFVFWLVLSGHYTVLITTFGVLTVLLTLYMARRMYIIDEEGHPIQLVFRAMFYWPWLAVEIAKSAISVSRLIIDPKLPITPTMKTVKPSQRSALGVNNYANSITLTPGTISVDVNRHEILVHAIQREGAEDVEAGEMDRRATAFEGKA